MSTCSSHYSFPPHMCCTHIKPLFCHILSSSHQASFSYILPPGIWSQKWKTNHFSFFFFRPAEQHQTWPQRPPDCKSAPPMDNAVQIGYKQQTTDQRYMPILTLILRCKSSHGRCGVSFWKGHPNLGIALWLILLWTPRPGLRLKIEAKTESQYHNYKLK